MDPFFFFWKDSIMESVYKKLIGKCIQEPHIYESNDIRIGQGDNVNYIHILLLHKM